MKKVLAILILLTIFSCSKGRDSVASATWKETDAQKSIAVEVLTVSKGKLINFIESSGAIKGNKEAWIVLESQGEVKNIFTNLGDRVKKGQTLISLDRELQTLNLDLAYEQLLKSESDFIANSEAYKNGNISKALLDQYNIAYIQSQTNYKLRKLELDKTTVKAPFNGEVALIDSQVVVGNYLTPGTRALRVVDLSSFKIQLSLGERQIGIINKGAEVSVALDIPGERKIFKGRVEAIGSGSDPNTGSFPVVISWNPNGTENLKSGMTGRVRIKTKDSLKKVVIPTSAVIQRDRVEGVFIERDGIALMTPIIKGESFGGRAVIKDGINEGDRIIISGLNSIGDRYKVDPTVVGSSAEWQ